MSAESVVLEALAKHRIYTDACRGCSWRIPQDYLASAHLTNEACDEHRAAEVAKALTATDGEGARLTEAERRELRGWFDSTERGRSRAVIEIVERILAARAAAPVEAGPTMLAPGVHSAGQDVAAAYRTGLADGKRNAEAGLAERVAERSTFHEVEGKRYRERMDLVERQPSRGGKNPERADAYDLGLNEGRALISELVAREYAALLRPAPAAERDEWCREESCTWRHWRSGDMPTHRRGADCPAPAADGGAES